MLPKTAVGLEALAAAARNIKLALKLDFYKSLIVAGRARSSHSATVDLN